MPAQSFVPAIVERCHLQSLFDALAGRGYRIIGPTVSDGAIVYDEVRSTSDLPAGISDQQERATYRLSRSPRQALFGYTCAAQSWKRFLHPPGQDLWRATRNGDGFDLESRPAPAVPLALVGVRSCELHAIEVQDRVFLHGPFRDEGYAARRSRLCIVAVACTQAAATCFCRSMGTGPRPTGGFDLALTERLDDSGHWFEVEAGSDLGASLLDAVPHRPFPDGGLRGADPEPRVPMGRSVDRTGVRDLLHRAAEHPRWDEIAARCFGCANCTMVCPTCFCTSIDDLTDLSGDTAWRTRRWDSCFGLEHSYIHGGSVRVSARSRYRQWLTHKFASWIDQFGVSGCVGCGRCITWCPAGIDVTEELRALAGERPAEREVAP